MTGHARVEKDRLVTPLVYSTEIARSVRIGRITEIRDAAGAPIPAATDGTVAYEEVAAGALRPRRGDRPVSGSYVVAGTIYGLVNVRTDGSRILCATLNEGNHSWEIKEFESRF